MIKKVRNITSMERHNEIVRPWLYLVYVQVERPAEKQTATSTKKARSRETDWLGAADAVETTDALEAATFVGAIEILFAVFVVTLAGRVEEGIRVEAAV